MVKNFFYTRQNILNPSLYINRGTGITVDGSGHFVFPTGALNFANRIDFNKISNYSDISFEYIINISAGLDSTSNLAFGFMCATRGSFQEAQSFVINNGSVDFYHANTLLQHMGTFDLSSYVGTTKRLKVTWGRKDDHYWIDIAGTKFDVEAIGDGGNYYRQNIYPAIFGNKVTIRVVSIRHYTNSGSVKFLLAGDSILLGLDAGAMSQSPTGVLRSLGIDVNRVCGSANILADALDAFYEIAIVKPKYIIVCYGHNDQFFATGNLLANLKKFVGLCQAHGITPIVCNVINSTWINSLIPNAIIQKLYFTSHFKHIDLYNTSGLIHPDDYIDGVHLQTVGNSKVAHTIYNYIKTLP